MQDTLYCRCMHDVPLLECDDLNAQSAQQTAELLFRIIISANQLSTYGAVADWREKFDQQISGSSGSTGKMVA